MIMVVLEMKQGWLTVLVCVSRTWCCAVILAPKSCGQRELQDYSQATKVMCQNQNCDF